MKNLKFILYLSIYLSLPIQLFSSDVLVFLREIGIDSVLKLIPEKSLGLEEIRLGRIFETKD